MIVDKYIFTKENMLSTLDIDIVHDDFDIYFYRDDDWSHMTSEFSISYKSKEGYSLYTTNYEDADVIRVILSIDTVLSPDGVIKPCILMQNPMIKNTITLVNQYIKVFMGIYIVNEFNQRDKIKLNLDIEYSNEDHLKIIKVTSTGTELFKYYDCYADIVEIDIEDFVNDLLDVIDIKELEINSDVAHIIELLKMQELVDEMDFI